MDADATPNATRLARLLAALQKALGHELPNQLVGVQGLARLLDLEEGERLSTEGRGYLRRVAAGAAKAHALVGTLAELARLGKAAAAAEAVDLAEAVAEAVAEAKQLAPGRRTEYHVGTIPALLLSAPRPALRKALVLVLRRAGIAATRVEVSARRAAGGAEVCIAGDGPAIPPDQVARLFEPFAGPNGHGLDLFLARELAEGWGGAVRVEPSGSAGTVFVVTCPLGDAGDQRQVTRD